jgi:hypothetical protein
MNDEYSRGELITDWSTVKAGSLIISNDHTYVAQFIACIDDKIIVRKGFDINKFLEFNKIDFNNYFYAIPKKKKVTRYLYGYVSGDGIYNIIARQWFKDDHDYINNAKIISDVFHRLDWTAKEFDE